MVIGRNQSWKTVSRNRAYYLLKDKETVCLKLPDKTLVELDEIPYSGSIKATNGKFYNDHNCSFIHVYDDKILSVYGLIEAISETEIKVWITTFKGKIPVGKLSVGDKVSVRFFNNTKDIVNIGVFRGEQRKTTSALGIDYADVYESVINKATWV